MSVDPYSEAQAAYTILRLSMNQRFSRGELVAIAGGELVANAESIEGLGSALSAMGLDLKDVVVAQAGVEPVSKFLGSFATKALIAHWIKCVLPTRK